MEAPDVDDEIEAPRWDPTKLTAVIVGAGPTGALAAHYFAMRGYTVQVYDKGPRPQPGDASSVPLVLTSRGAIAYEELSLDSQHRVGPRGTPLRGVWRLGQGRELQEVDTTSGYRRTFVVDRSGMASDLIAEAEKRYPGKVTFHFGTELVRAELKNRNAVVKPAGAAAGEGEVEVSYDLLVGADGVGSTVRDILKAKVKDFRVTSPVADEGAAFKPLRRLPPPSKEFLLGFFTHRPQEYLYEWSKPGAPTLRLFLDQGGTACGTLAAPLPGGWGAAEWGDGARVAAALAAAYPGLPEEWVTAIGEQVSSPSSAPPRVPTLLQCNQFHGPRAVLVGDAAHGVTAAGTPVGAGQGPSAAVESVRTLALVLRGAQDDLDKVPEVYSNVRSDAVMAMQTLEFMEVTNPDAGRQVKFASPWYSIAAFFVQCFRALSHFVGAILSFIAPGRFLSAPQVVSRLEDRRIGYSEVMKMLQGYATPVVVLVLGCIVFALFKGYSRVLA
ncbi:hypothetical protein HYH03_003381 [Edaphochlamys debaryana]|uniref:FAD-binding domain-containing protein n=1 Tax=Edaphochlamys debaryana TaxID=47281 RepID=A0A835YJ63_9CHLO|nr:hypothetical protein HYH03_003381 [Edaphochlamys debaryana]|eukprot:KAG2498634.1 hypothetical protein HYH03_003381 [Edaphochlamys debaryana]